ncbi:MAG: RHS repeat-associated core domain-containing protein [Gemmataceae bacterium]|nr:RHS repeat-associated core domain-containing protein [Gemmataceae bacterium]
MQREFNGLGQLTKEYQAHNGAVNTSTSPKVVYAYSEMSGGANHSRLTSITYPNSRVIGYNYASGLDSSISRLTSLTDGSTTLEAYTYLGLGIVVKRAHPEPGVDLTYIKQSGEGNGDAGDPYTGLDRFGRIKDQRWIKTSDGSHTDRFQYGYDRDGNRLYRDNLVNNDFDELYHANGASNGYDSRNQLTDLRRGPLSDTNSDNVPDTVTTASRSQSWTLDATGNWDSLTSDGTPQSRTHNRQNQLTGVGSSSLTFDGNGNLKTDEAGQQYAYDAWNRLVQVKDASNNVLASYQYDGLGRRIVEAVGGTTRDLYYSAGWQVLEERVSGQAQVQYVWSPVYVDALILRDRDTDGNGSLDERLYVQQDANYNVTALIDTSGQVVERFIEDGYGKVTVLALDWSTRGSSDYTWRYLHQGTRYEWVTGLYHVRARDTDPDLGRWLQVDPLGLGPDINPYRYEGNGPVNALDPSGLFGLVQILFGIGEMRERREFSLGAFLAGVNMFNTQALTGFLGTAREGLVRQSDIAWGLVHFASLGLVKARPPASRFFQGVQEAARQGKVGEWVREQGRNAIPFRAAIEAAVAGDRREAAQQVGAMGWVLPAALGVGAGAGAGGQRALAVQGVGGGRVGVGALAPAGVGVVVDARAAGGLWGWLGGAQPVTAAMFARRRTDGVGDPPEQPVFGARGVQTPSTTVYNKKGVRIDVENPNPGQRPGQIHVQVGDAKYLYDPASRTFPGVPKSLRRILESNEVRKAIDKALRILGES